MLEIEGEITIKFLGLVNRYRAIPELVRAAATFFRQVTGCETVGLRLREEQGVPYYEVRGGLEEFVRREGAFCGFHPNGESAEERSGGVEPDCLCERVLAGNLDLSQPFFTSAGSFWTNSMSRLLADGDAVRRIGLCSRCNDAGYESIALIPLVLGTERLGLLQLCSGQEEVFSPRLIALWERLAGYLAVALGKALAEEALRESEERHRNLFEHNHAAMLLIDTGDGQIVDANPAASVFYGWSRSELKQKKISDINLLPHADVMAQLKLARQARGGPYLFRHRTAGGTIRDVEVFSGPISLKGRTLLFSVVHDVTERQRREAILKSRLVLSEFALTNPLQALLRKTLDEAERLTGSRIGFFHILAKDEKTVLPQVWSTNTIQGPCTVASDGNHSVERAGVWIDCLRERRAVIHNDYASLPHRRGLPEGHIPVERELVVPVIRGERVVAVLGVGNKPVNYGAGDVETVSLLADLAWDISERKRSEGALQDVLRRTRASEERLSVILRAVTDGLLALDGEGRVMLMNPAAERLFRTSIDEAAGRPAQEVIDHQAFLSSCLDFLKNDSATDTVEIEIFDEAQDRSRDIQVRFARLPKSDDVSGGVTAALFDVTRDRDIERLKRDFVMTAAHELRTPLTVILGYAELLEEAGSADLFTPLERREFVGQILEKGAVLVQIIDDLLDLGRVEEGWSLFLDKAPCDLTRIIEGAADHYRRKTHQHRFELKLPSGGLPVVADKVRLSQVFDNLLTNAIKYSPDGGPILIEALDLDGEIQVSVADAGIGMTEEQVGKIFDRFYRVDTSMTAVGGLGLGMSVVKGIIEAHGGQIWVDSAPQTGTRVSFSLPMESFPPAAEEEGDGATGSAAGEP